MGGHFRFWPSLMSSDLWVNVYGYVSISLVAVHYLTSGLREVAEVPLWPEAVWKGLQPRHGEVFGFARFQAVNY